MNNKIKNLLEYCLESVCNTQGQGSNVLLFDVDRNEGIDEVVSGYPFLRIEMIPELRYRMFVILFSWRRLLLKFSNKLKYEVMEFAVVIMMRFMDLSKASELKSIDVIQIRRDLIMCIFLVNRC